MDNTIDKQKSIANDMSSSKDSLQKKNPNNFPSQVDIF